VLPKLSIILGAITIDTNTMRHLVTGGSGFLGNLIVRRMLDQGAHVRVLDIWDDSQRPKGAEFVLGNILDPSALKRALAGIDVVHHTAALVPLTKSGDLFHRVNVDGTRMLAQEAVAAGAQSFVHLSSSAIFGKPACPVKSDAKPAPLEIYGRSKLQGELAAAEILGQAGVPLISVRPRTIIAEERLGIFQLLFDWIKSDINVYVIGDGQNKIQFLHADDLIDCYFMLVENQKPGFYNVGASDFGALKPTLETLIAHAGSRSKVKQLPAALTVGTLATLDRLGLSPLAPWHYLTYGEDFYFDLEPLQKLGYNPKYSNDRMLAESYDSFVANYDRLMHSKGGSAHRKPVKEQVLKLLKLVSRFT
jgi:nucleoside-diphosphate-sugar epimerase